MKKTLAIFILILTATIAFAQDVNKLITSKEALRIETFLAADELKNALNQEGSAKDVCFAET